MRPGRIVALVLGCLLVAPGLGMLVGGAGLSLAALARDADGYTTATVSLASPTAAITTDDLTFRIDVGTPEWAIELLDAQIRMEVADADQDVFVGVAPTSDVDAWLDGVAHDRISAVEGNGDVAYRNRAGTAALAPPGTQDFWAASTTSSSGSEVTWTIANGDWTGVVANVDGSPGVVADVRVGFRAGFLGPLAIILLVVGALTTLAAVVLIVVGASGQRRDPDRPTGPGAPAVGTDERVAPPPPPAMAGRAAGGPPPAPPTAIATNPAPHPVTLQAALDPDLSRWQWLVKWFLAIPHFLVLAFLWTAFVLLTIVAGVAILFTGTYPRGIFDFNVGVLRWSWRVSYYASTGGIGTDRYPPFSLDDDPTYPARLDVARPQRLSRGLVLVKWLLAFPHWIVVALLVGSIEWLPANGGPADVDAVGWSGILGLLVVVAGIVLLFAGRYPPALFDIIVGLNRWLFRVVAYVALMTDEYPPFRLDQGGDEPAAPSPGPTPRAPAARQSVEAAT